MALLENIYTILNGAVDDAFLHEKYNLKFFEYLKGEKVKQNEIKIFIESSLSIAIKDQIDELNLYLDGGKEAECVKESYAWMGKPRARKIKDYLENIMEDAIRYEESKRRGPKRKSKSVTTK